MSTKFGQWIVNSNFGFTAEDYAHMSFGVNGVTEDYTWSYEIAYYGRNRDRLYQLNSRVTNRLKSMGVRWKWHAPVHDDHGRCVQLGSWTIERPKKGQQTQTQAAINPVTEAYNKGRADALAQEAEKRKESARRAANARWTRNQEERALNANPNLN